MYFINQLMDGGREGGRDRRGDGRTEGRSVRRSIDLAVNLSIGWWSDGQMNGGNHLLILLKCT